MRGVLLILLVALPCAAAKDLAREVDALAQPVIGSGSVVGMTIGVIEARDKQPWVRGYGKVTVGEKDVPDQDTVYEIGSISKVFTGVLLAALVQDGSVRLDQPLEQLLPDTVQVPAHGGRKITLVDLSTHTSALPRMPSNFAPKDPNNPYADYTPALMYAFLSGCTLKRAPGLKSAYSNLGAGLLGHALARKAGKSYEALLVERITEPLGMPSTRIVYTQDMRKRLAPPYRANGVPSSTWDIPTLAGAGGIRSSVRDMLAFLQANLAEKDGGMHAALALARKVHHKPGAPQAQKLGLGWHIDPLGYRRHNGQTGGYHSFAAVDTQRGHALVILSNTADGVIDSVGRRIMKLLRGEQPPREAQVDPKIYDAYAGAYALTPQFVLTVTREGDKLMVQATGQAKLQVFPESETSFFYKVVDARITFHKQDGRVVALTLHQHGRAMRAPRQP
ncbi:MAG: serine hydrolase [Planctomycetota bacterium]|nr:serine hydrolase [Planctomycetota bacterium]